MTFDPPRTLIQKVYRMLALRGIMERTGGGSVWDDKKARVEALMPLTDKYSRHHNKAHAPHLIHRAKQNSDSPGIHPDGFARPLHFRRFLKSVRRKPGVAQTSRPLSGH